MVEIGQAAPAFAGTDQHGEAVSLEALSGTAVLLVFYPFTFTGICEAELCRLRDDQAVFTDAGVQIVAVSCDPAPAQKRWAEEQGWTFPVISDFWPHGAIAQAYDVFNAERGLRLAGHASSSGPTARWSTRSPRTRWAPPARPSATPRRWPSSSERAYSAPSRRRRQAAAAVVPPVPSTSSTAVATRGAGGSSSSG